PAAVGGAEEAAAEVREQEPPVELGYRRSPVDHPARDRARPAVAAGHLDDRHGETRRVAVRRLVAVEPLGDGPPVVDALLRDRGEVDLLVAVLADVADPHVLAVDPEPPGVAQATVPAD